MVEVARRCTVCKADSMWRLEMRACNHVVCAECALSHLKKWMKLGKARIKCPKRKCTMRVHPNDVDALLDEDNPQVLQHIEKKDLQWLRDKNIKNSISYAFGGNVGFCPNCKEMYGQVPGCNYVKCANRSCQTMFCWTCGKKQTSWQHFGSNALCRVSWDDIYKGTWLFRFIFMGNPCFLFCLSPIVWLFLFICMPVYVWFSFPYYMGRRRWRQMRENGGNEKLTIAIIVLTTPIFFFVGMMLGVFSYCWLFGLWYAFAGFTLCKCIPVIGKVFDLLDLIQCFAGLLGFHEWQKIIRDSKEQRELMLVDKQHMHAERSERVPHYPKDHDKEP